MTSGSRRRGRGPVRLACAAAATAAFFTAAPASAQGALPDDFFGAIPPGPSVPAMSQMKANGVDTVRMPVEWSRIEPQPGQRDWSYFDYYVGSLAAAGLQAQPVLFGVPPWISQKPARAPIYTAAQRRAWSTFVTDFAARYGRGGLFWTLRPDLPRFPLTKWEVWNEPNLSGYWAGRPSPRRFVTLLKITRTALRAADPAAEVAVGGIYPPPRPKYGVSMRSFVERLYRAPGARGAFDAIALHPYSSRPKGVLSFTRELRKLIVENGDRRTPIWITEVGWTTAGAGLGKSPFKSTEQSQAKYLRLTFNQLIRERKRLKLQLLVWHAWQDSPSFPGAPWTGFSGLLRNDGTAKPSLAAYRSVALKP